ncbi:hypothetical protein [Bifidobacterium bombi]|uniref:Copper-translocating P-type ATPase n=1 Tax=Bifidobacterium bombi DSM 19703 TaxID=1341695 RepID=A0A080N392_9BIFI|nr:hypothetical protein [Bifidobacterium bombi]KFF31582.1 copper-translocating P-type ATPase [Bifidobacterium bombi DSM 19703]
MHISIFNIFQDGLAAVVAAVLTWFVIQFFHSDGADASTEATLLGHGDMKAVSDPSKLRDYTKHTSRSLAIAAILTVPVLVVSLFTRSAPGFLPSWLDSPWLQAILITPVMFYCGSSVLHEGWEALKHRIPGRSVLISLGIIASYLYSMVLCIAGNQLPNGSHPYFEVTGIIISLSLFVDRLKAGALRLHSSTSQRRTANVEASTQLAHVAAFIRVFVIASLCAAIWCFAIFLVFGPQPRLANALIIAIGVLLITGLFLSAYSIWELAREPRTNQD